MSIEVLDRPPDHLTIPSGEHVATPGTRLSVIVPAYREGQHIAQNLWRLLSELDGLGITFEVIVVSDGNTDNTVPEAESVVSPNIKVVEYNVNMGKGYALRCGVSRSSGELITFIDADMELDPRYIKPFLAVMDGFDCDAVIGSKRHPMSSLHYPLFRRFQSWVYQLIIRMLFHLKVRDTQTGLKLFKRQVLEEVLPLLAIKRFAFDLELLVVARTLGYKKVMEAPVELNYKFQSTADLKATWNVLWDTAAIFYRLHFLRFYAHQRAAILHERDMAAGR